MRHFRRSAAALVAMLTVAGSLGLPAGASPIDDKRAQAEQLSRQIEALGNRESALAEKYNQAVLARHDVEQKTAAAQAKLDQAKAQAATVRQSVRDAAVNAYVDGGSPLQATTTNPQSGVYAHVYIETLTGNASDTLDALSAAQAQVGDEQQQLDVAKADADMALRTIDARRRDVSKTESSLNATLSKVKGDLQTLVAQAEAARRAADAQRAAALARAAQDRASRSRSPASFGAAPAPNRGAQAAVAEALRQVGKPYQWGAAGPDAFDCSGLTMWAWRAGGVSLPHYTGAQYSSTTHIPLSALQPGDLVYSEDMGHMAMYIGNGNMVEAPHTGAVVRVVPLRPDLDLASRP